MLPSMVWTVEPSQDSTMPTWSAPPSPPQLAPALDDPRADRLGVQAELLAALGYRPAGGDDVVRGLPEELLGVLGGGVLSHVCLHLLSETYR